MFQAKPSTCFFVGNSDIDNNAGDSGAICFHSDGGVAADTQFRSETEAIELNSMERERKRKWTMLRRRNSEYRKRDRTHPVLRAEEYEGVQRLENPKLSMQKAPTRGKRRRSVKEEKRDDGVVGVQVEEEQSVGAILGSGD